MAILSVAEVRRRVAETIEALQTPAQWTESRWPYDAFPEAEPSGFAHLAFAVGTPSTEFTAPHESVGHKRGTAGGRVRTEVGIRWAFQLRSDAIVDRYDAALDAEAVLIKGLVDATLTDMHLTLTDMQRATVAGGAFLLGSVRCVVEHRVALL